MIHALPSLPGAFSHEHRMARCRDFLCHWSHPDGHRHDDGPEAPGTNKQSWNASSMSCVFFFWIHIYIYLFFFNNESVASNSRQGTAWGQCFEVVSARSTAFTVSWSHCGCCLARLMGCWSQASGDEALEVYAWAGSDHDTSLQVSTVLLGEVGSSHTLTAEN